MTINDLREQISILDDGELWAQLELYQSLQSRGVRDEIMITLLEEETYSRTDLDI